jgi:hypothetical protein
MAARWARARIVKARKARLLGLGKGEVGDGKREFNDQSKSSPQNQDFLAGNG